MSKRNIFATTISLIIFSCQAALGAADPYARFFSHVEKEFDAAKTTEEKLRIVSMPLNFSAIRSVKESDDIDLNELRKDEKGQPITITMDGKSGYCRYDLLKGGLNPGLVFDFMLICPKTKTPRLSSSDGINVLALVISQAKTELLQKFLSVVEDINSPLFAVYGYRQEYTLAHVALDPHGVGGYGPFAAELKGELPLEKRLEIIDMLAQKGLDFNGNHASGSYYVNPPLAAGQPRGDHSGPRQKQSRIRAFLYGADPLIWGSSFTMGGMLNTNKYASFPWDEVLEDAINLSKKGIKITPCDFVKDRLTEAKARKIKELQALSF